MPPYLGLIIGALALIVVIFVLYRLSAAKKGSENEKTDINDNSGIVLQQGEEAVAADIENAHENDSELIAVLTAAITAVYEAAGAGCSLRVKSFRRIPASTPAWNIAGRSERITSKL